MEPTGHDVWPHSSGINNPLQKFDQKKRGNRGKERVHSGGGDSGLGDQTQKKRRSGGEEAFGSGIRGVGGDIPPKG